MVQILVEIHHYNTFPQNPVNPNLIYLNYKFGVSLDLFHRIFLEHLVAIRYCNFRLCVCFLNEHYSNCNHNYTLLKDKYTLHDALGLIRFKVVFK